MLVVLYFHLLGYSLFDMALLSLTLPLQVSSQVNPK